MRQYFYRIKSARKGVSCSTAIWAEDMEQAYLKIKVRHNITIQTDHYDSDSMLAGCAWRKYYAIEGQKVELSISPML